MQDLCQLGVAIVGIQVVETTQHGGEPGNEKARSQGAPMGRIDVAADAKRKQAFFLGTIEFPWKQPARVGSHGNRGVARHQFEPTGARQSIQGSDIATATVPNPRQGLWPQLGRERPSSIGPAALAHARRHRLQQVLKHVCTVGD